MSKRNGHYLRKGDRVRVNSHRHPDVLPFTEGIIDCHKEDGYGVEITGSWSIAGHDRGGVKYSTEVVWFPSTELELV